MLLYKVTVSITNVDFKNLDIHSSLPAIISPDSVEIPSLQLHPLIFKIKRYDRKNEPNNFEDIFTAYAQALNFNYLHLFVTEEFLKYYKILVNSKIILEKIEVVPLSRVTFGVCGNIKADRKHKFDILCKTGKTISKSDLFDLKSKDESSLLVLECEPTYCGEITPTTSFTFITLNDNEFVEILKDNQTLQINPINTNFSLIIINNGVSKKLSVKFLTEDMSYTKKMSDADQQNRMYISDKAFTELELDLKYTLELETEGDYPVELSSFENISKTSKRYFSIGQFKGEEDKYPYSAFLTPQLWFNLAWKERRSTLKLKASSKNYKECFPKAKLIYLAPVNDGFSQYSLSGIENYFSQDRYLAKNDVVAIPSAEDPQFPEKQDEIMLKCFSKPLLYFKVAMIEAESSADFGSVFTINKKTCKFSWLAATNHYVPAAMSVYYNTPSLLWNSLEPPGLQPYVREMVDSIQPFLTAPELARTLAPHTLVVGPSGAGKTILIRAACLHLNLHYQELNALEFTRDVLSNSEINITNVLKKATSVAPCVIHFRNLDLAYTGLKEAGGTKHVHILMSLIQNFNKDHDLPVVAVASVHDTSNLPSSIFSVFLHTITIESLSEESRRDVISQLLSSTVSAPSVSPGYIAQRTAGFLLGDLVDTFTHAMHSALSRIQDFRKNNSKVTEKMCADSGVQLLQDDFIKSINHFQSHKAYGQGRPSIPEVHWNDIGGLQNVKKEILDTFQLPIQHPELLQAGLHRTGVLLYGPPGTGKTLLAKAVATECSLNFFSVKGPELVNMYVGQSEQNVRDVFSRARAAAPCIIFFDELDSLAPNRGHSGDSGGVMDRVVSQLLVELDGLSKSNDVFVIGATNRPDLLDPSLLRPGRFDRLLYVGIQEDFDSRHEILKALMRKLNTTVDSCALAANCPPHLTGADFYSLCSSAMMNALARTIEAIEANNLPMDTELWVQQEDFDKALLTLVPSVSALEVQHYQKLRDKIEKSRA